MKSNVVITRKMGEFDVLQRTSDGYFDANYLWAQWVSLNPTKHTVNEFLNLNKTKEFIDELKSQSQLNGDADFEPVKIIKSVMTKNGKTRSKIWNVLTKNIVIPYFTIIITTMGLIKNYPELITTMRKMYNDKYQKF